MDRPVIVVLAGVNGAGKSSVLGGFLNERGLKFYNPDAFARTYLKENPSKTQREANSAAWNHGKVNLEAAIEERKPFLFETTLGGNTIPKLLLKATETHNVKVLYCGLENVEMHIARVKQRVTQGGHDIPEEDIRRRWDNSVSNLIMLMPYLAELKVFDNSAQGLLDQIAPKPVTVLVMQEGKITFPNTEDADAMKVVKEWVRPLIMAAVDLKKKNIPNI